MRKLVSQLSPRSSPCSKQQAGRHMTISGSPRPRGCFRWGRCPYGQGARSRLCIITGRRLPPEQRVESLDERIRRGVGREMTMALVSAPSNLGLRPPQPTSVPGCAKAPGLREAGLFQRLAEFGAVDAGVVLPGRYADDRPGAAAESGADRRACQAAGRAHRRATASWSDPVGNRWGLRPPGGRRAGASPSGALRAGPP